jgi:putative phosphoesterase
MQVPLPQATLLQPDSVVARIGLISDTHMPERCAALPPALFDVLSGADLLLHAGDVGELHVLDRLSDLAPVIAVHGNDDTAESQRELPYQQVIIVAGQRILLTHSHHPDREEELAARRIDAWQPKLARWAAMGQRAGATIVVFGHTHIPMAHIHDGVLLINPGAIASGGYVTRQRVRTVATLLIRADGTPLVTHVDLDAPGQPYLPDIDWSAGFRTAMNRFSASILDPELERIWEEGRWASLAKRAPQAHRAALLRAAHRCWAGEKIVMTTEDLLEELRLEPDISPELLRQFEALATRS